MLWRPGRLYIPVNTFSGLQAITTLKGGAAGTAIGYDADAAGWKATKAAATDRLSKVVTQMASVDAAVDPTTLTMRQVSTFGVSGYLVTTAGDDLYHYQHLPSDLDISKPIKFYVHWTCEAAAVGARTITWRVRYLKIVPNTTALAAATTVLDTVIGAQAPAGTSGVVQRTTEALSGAILPAVTAVAHDVEALLLRVDMSAFNAALTEAKYLLGLEIVYTPHRLMRTRMTNEAKSATYMLSDLYAN